MFVLVSSVGLFRKCSRLFSPVHGINDIFYGSTGTRYHCKAAFPFMRTIYRADFVRAVLVRVTNSDQIIFNVGVSFCADFCTDK